VVLREIPGVRQDRPNLRRRWYQDEFFDLYTWHAPGGVLVGFQLCYDVRGRERALTWQREHGFSHTRIDAGEGGKLGRMTPILIGGGRFPHRLVRERFAREATTLDAAARDFIVAKMREYGREIARGAIAVPRHSRVPPDDTDPV
jgi:hypothetical protein